MKARTPVIYVWSASDQEKYQKYQDAARWLLAPIILLGLLIFIVTIWGFIEFRDCSWKIAPPTVCYGILLTFFALSIVILVLGGYGLVIFNNEDSQKMGQFIRLAIIFSVCSVILMIVLWTYTIYKHDGRFTIDTMELSYTCLKDVAECWDSIHIMHSCCGWNSPKDWQYIPHSCCDQFINYGKEICEKSKDGKGIPLEAAFQEGCRSHLYSRSLVYFILASLSWVIAIILFVMSYNCDKQVEYSTGPEDDVLASKGLVNSTRLSVSDDGLLQQLAVIFLAIHLLRGLKIKEKLKPIIGQ